MARSRRPPAPPPPCPHCGKPTALGGRFCRGCGWDADIVERGEGYLDGVDLPEPADGTEDPGLPGAPRRGRAALWSLTACLLLIAMLWLLLARGSPV
jgi:hypothetical protein